MEDHAVKAAEQEDKVPMTKQGSCRRCGQAGTVIFYE